MIIFKKISAPNMEGNVRLTRKCVFLAVGNEEFNSPLRYYAVKCIHGELYYTILQRELFLQTDHNASQSYPNQAGEFPGAHFTLHPMLGFHGPGTVFPCNTASMAPLKSSPLTGADSPYLLGLLESNCP